MKLITSSTVFIVIIFFFFFFFFTPMISSAPTPASTPCRSFCGTIPINYPFGIDDGCGAPQFRHMLNCSSPNDLFFITPSGTYKIQHIDYPKKTLTIYDPSMSTCSILQPHHDFLMTEIQSAIIPPTPDTVFALLNCSVDSPVLNHYKNLCFDFSSHSCDELYSSCNAFRVFRLLNNNINTTTNNNSSSSLFPPSSTSSSPPCCFTGYDTIRYMSMNILDCSHYTTVVNTDELRGIGPLDWVYGIKLSYSLPETGCDRCSLSGGTCGFDTETEGRLCLCSVSTNSTRQCGAGSITSAGVRRSGRGHSLLTSWLVGFTLAGVFLLLRTPWPCSAQPGFAS
ncbi:hypothetical protein LINPERPRIM_LOCUS5621 [Linum perenne]